MTPEELITTLSRYVSLNKTEAVAFHQYLMPMTVRRRTHLLNAGQFVDTFYWVQKGCLMAYYRDEGGLDHAMQFAVQHWWTTDLEAFSNGTKARYHIVALEESEVLVLKKQDMDTLLTLHPPFERYFRKIFQNALLAHQKRIIQNIAFTAEERYEEFLRDYGTVERWVPQKYIASYLGMTPEFLSKIRSRRTKKSAEH